MTLYLARKKQNRPFSKIDGLKNTICIVVIIHMRCSSDATTAKEQPAISRAETF